MDAETTAARGLAMVVKNPEISAVLLVAVGANRRYVCGTFNPSPTHRLDTASLWAIPCLPEGLAREREPNAADLDTRFGAQAAGDSSRSHPLKESKKPGSGVQFHSAQTSWPIFAESLASA
jgi:hypothetical protein